MEKKGMITLFVPQFTPVLTLDTCNVHPTVTVGWAYGVACELDVGSPSREGLLG